MVYPPSLFSYLSVWQEFKFIMENKTPLFCLLLSPQESGLLRALLMEHPSNETAQQLLVRLESAENAQLLPMLSRALAHVGLSR
jgi:hypothetical protein